MEIMSLHSCLVIANSKNFLSHSMSIGMDSFTTFMDCSYDHVDFMSIHASEQEWIIITFVEHITIQEELGW